MRYLTGKGNFRCRMHLVRQISVGHFLVGDVSGRGSVCWGCVWLGKCPSGMCLVGEMSVGEESVGDVSGTFAIIITNSMV